MEPIVISIPHSGTRFLKNRLGITEAHHVNPWPWCWEQVQGRKVIAPIRPPLVVWNSWCRRRNKDELLNWSCEFFLSWGLLNTLNMLVDVDFICIDKQEDPRITDWTPMGDEDPTQELSFNYEVNLDAIHRLPFVEERYGKWGAWFRENCEVTK